MESQMGPRQTAVTKPKLQNANLYLSSFEILFDF